MKGDQRILDLLISVPLAPVKEPASGGRTFIHLFWNLNLSSYSVIYFLFVNRINEEKMNFVFVYLVISCFDCWDFSLITVYAFNRETTF